MMQQMSVRKLPTDPHCFVSHTRGVGGWRGMKGSV